MSWRVDASRASNPPLSAASSPSMALSPFSSLYAPTFGSAPGVAEEAPILSETAAADLSDVFSDSRAVPVSPPVWGNSHPPPTGSAAAPDLRAQGPLRDISTPHSRGFAQEHEEDLRDLAGSLLAAVDTAARRFSGESSEDKNPLSYESAQGFRKQRSQSVSSEGQGMPESVSVKISNPKLAALEVSVQSRLLPHVEASLENLQAFLDTVRAEKEATLAALPVGGFSQRLCAAIESEDHRLSQWKAENARKFRNGGN
ncbi:conserved hypothetical protein [Neospora caninum Liverpool]|uniref:Uncharacterized protein n=1 Tax=Neospora caninum (strain Liverpool) TaxID=572307 RepID=F0V8Q1_NEOCL|nr:conserved hypothetical protein [Neospora caninum Liverpool]CBZ50092.1 conserved hypothetical protein [Neospora caninum Liverpool]CEL64687.1 TPA: hypothetical protein BN1204_005680 [Neospora caninum Liverpool]|eukprot:XP_003880127.1 conserved hypothetical protein [Neospora caninum Liverpool]